MTDKEESLALAQRLLDEPNCDPDDDLRVLSRQLQRCEEARVKLQAFKDWVHAYLDVHGVPHHPPGTHGAAGCRIGDRMDWLMAEVNRLRHRLNHQTEDDVEACRQGKHEGCGK